MNTLILNKEISEKMLSFFKKEYKIILTKEIKSISTPLKFHPDIQIAQIDDDTFVCEPTVFEYYKSVLKDKNIIMGETYLQSNYPRDIAYNIIRVGNKCLCNLKYTDKKILENINCKMININQGYAKCSICQVDDNSVITSDDGIEKVCKENRIDVLKIEKSQIELKPYDYGFIGGASLKLNKDEILFFGDITKHSDYHNIKEFCDKKNIKIKYFDFENLIDFGSGFSIY
ncbi:MAG: hypothetical protein E7391_03590 [Ruminococcaceae bacterium]|nr:hypothetical protein [Oscillospiraceae bacterium]